MTVEDFKHRIIPLQSAMQTLAEHMLGNPDDAADTVQEVFITLWNKRDQLDTIINLQSYCLQSIRLRCIDTIRKQKLIYGTQAPIPTANDTETIPDLQSPPDQQILDEVNETERRAQLIYSLLDQLPEKQRKLIELKYFQNYDTDQLQSALNLSPSNLYTTLHRTLNTLRQKLEKIL